MNLSAIDQETSSTKTLVVTADRSIFAATDMELWRSVIEAGRHPLANAGQLVAAVGHASTISPWLASLRTWRIL